ncbi:extensin [Dorcoceras hygrometricum]|uniref:Extensin n=1 Tax=Dorcoceras hygrometricum TaxID=472368 RepID=A0A2Z7AWI2_9LAMI|nr:extensin [Dorcoceras hygrometricum]
MVIEVEHTSSPIQTVTMTQSSASTSGPKTSVFIKKPGFVIPKNKLSGSLVPLFRGPKKGDGDTLNEEASTQVQRKTKWGPDLTLDATVRKGRASAYQARINQISQQLTLGSLAMDYNQDSLSTSEFGGGKPSSHQLSQETLEMLEVERREIIGELLKLNPSYKAPPDYKPLLKEANVPIPIKEYPGYNFIGLIFGPANDTQKRLEKETGAKIRVYGTKADKGGKFEVTATDAKETVSSYEDLYVHISADTFEKIDAAVALIELLVTPVSVNPLSSSTTLTPIADDSVTADPTQSMPSSFKAPALANQGIAQPFAGLLPTQTQGDMPQYPQAWFSPGPTQTPLFPHSGIVPPINSSAPLPGNPMQANSTSMPSFFGPPPVIPASFSLVPQNSSFVASRPLPPIALQPPQIPMAPLLVRSQGNSALASQNMSISVAPRVNLPNNMISPILMPPIPPLGMRAPSPNIMTGSTPIPFPGTSSAPFLQPGINNSISSAIPRPQHGNSGDFTFQPQRPQNIVSQVSLQSNQTANHNLAPPTQPGHAPLTPPSSLVRPLISNMNPYQVQSFPRIHVSHQMNQPRPQISTNSAGSQAAPLVPPRGLPLPGHNTISLGAFQHMQPRGFTPPPVVGNPAGPFPPRAANQINSIPQSHSPGANPQRFPSPHPHFGNYSGKQFSGGTQQIYDPFSPTTVPLNPQLGGNAARLHNEIDPEYEDLMASVGVK